VVRSTHLGSLRKRQHVKWQPNVVVKFEGLKRERARHAAPSLFLQGVDDLLFVFFFNTTDDMSSKNNLPFFYLDFVRREMARKLMWVIFVCRKNLFLNLFLSKNI